MTGGIKTVSGWLGLPIVAAVLIASCSGNDTTDQTLADAEVDAVGGLGSEVYANNCASCHGADLRGTDKGPSQLSIVYEPNHHPDDAYRSAIANGAPQHHWTFGNMPPVEGLSGEEVEAVIAFIRAEQERLGFEQ